MCLRYRSQGSDPAICEASESPNLTDQTFDVSRWWPLGQDPTGSSFQPIECRLKRFVQTLVRRFICHGSRLLKGYDTVLTWEIGRRRTAPGAPSKGERGRPHMATTSTGQIGWSSLRLCSSAAHWSHQPSGGRQWSERGPTSRGLDPASLLRSVAE